jgi:hypothetical protein
VARLPFTSPRDRASGTLRLLARGLAAGRVALGIALVAAPDVATRRWLGEASADDPGRQIAVRGLGARDVALGVGTLVALRGDGDLRRAAHWLEAGVVADLADAASTAVTEDLDVSRATGIAVALGAAGLGLGLRARLR